MFMCAFEHEYLIIIYCTYQRPAAAMLMLIRSAVSSCDRTLVAIHAGISGAGAVLRQKDRPDNEVSFARFLGHCTNNGRIEGCSASDVIDHACTPDVAVAEAEYHALILGLEMAQLEGVRHIVVVADSQLMERQISGAYQVRI